MHRWTDGWMDGQDGGEARQKQESDRSHDVLLLRVESARMDDMNGREEERERVKAASGLYLLTLGRDILLYELNG